MQVPVALTLHCFYKRLVVRKHHPIPKGVPVIYCSNHQNAFLDALLIAIVTNTQPASLVRADVFNNPIAKRFLNALKMMPVFRMRDGFNTLSNNDTIFSTVRNLLLDNGSIIIFPEGNHGERKQLRPLKKGVGRIAMSTLAEHPDCKDIQVLPIGLEYSNHQNFRSSVMVEIGEPISVSKYISEYKQNEAITLRNFNEELKDAIGKLMLDIKHKAKYDLVHDFIDSKVLTTHTAAVDFVFRFELARRLIAELNEKQEGEITKEGLENWWSAHPEWKALTEKNPNILFKIVTGICTLPFLPVYAACRAIGNKFTKDPQFVSSLKAVSGMVLFPVLMLIYTLLLSSLLSGADLVLAIAGMLLAFWGSLHFFND